MVVTTIFADVTLSKFWEKGPDTVIELGVPPNTETLSRTGYCSAMKKIELLTKAYPVTSVLGATVGSALVRACPHGKAEMEMTAGFTGTGSSENASMPSSLYIVYISLGQPETAPSSEAEREKFEAREVAVAAHPWSQIQELSFASRVCVS
jgi:hypothetical protein